MLEIVEDQIQELKKLWKNKRLLLHQALNLAMIVFSALMIWKGLMFVTKSESPVVVVLSGSMEPAFQRGDILFLNNQDNPIRVGEVVVFKIKDRDIPIVHRVMKAAGRATRGRGSGRGRGAFDPERGRRGRDTTRRPRRCTRRPTAPWSC
mmetsp:Transcript_2790/g.8144  ORF Transcript_2790/g.8144 Transcript_2790/m.8144 type:complete len:150 (+) Transcript_2790:241-690(+)